MPNVAEIAAFLEQFAPLRLAEDWDNVGLLIGDRSRSVERLMTCLTVTPESAAEAVEQRVELIVTHHPMPFLSLNRITADNTVGRMILSLITAGVAVYSPHTAFDSAADGVNQRLAAGLELQNIAPLIPHPEGLGTGRFGSLPKEIPLAELAERLKSFLKIQRLQIVGRPDRVIRTVATACGAADELLDAARQHNCDALVIGEARFHTCLEAQASDIALLMPGHFASERFAVEHLAEVLKKQFPGVHAWSSRREQDPVAWG